MNIDTIRILGIDYNVVITDSVDKLNGDNYGCMDGMISTICIKSSCKPDSMQAATLIHEIIEAINERLELNLEHNKITSLDAALTDVLLSNPNLLKELSKAAKR